MESFQKAIPRLPAQQSKVALKSGTERFRIIAPVARGFSKEGRDAKKKLHLTGKIARCDQNFPATAWPTPNDRTQSSAMVK